MIEFNGYLTGAARKRCYNRGRALGLKIALPALLLLSPLLIYAIIHKHLIVAVVFAEIFVLLPLLVGRPFTKKEKLATTPKRIYIEDKHIVCITDRYEEIRKLKDVKRVTDRGEYYEIDFVYGRLSSSFVCQKKLLSKGTLEKFEALFEGKLVKNLGS